MCDPLSMAVTSFTIGAAQQVMSYGAAKNNAAQQTAFYEQNRRNAIMSASLEQQQLDLRRTQEEAKASEESFDAMLEIRKRKATAEVAAGEAGITGLSVDGLLRDFDVAAGRTSDRIQANTEMTTQQLSLEKQGVRARMNDRINSVRPGTQPSGLALGLGIAAQGVDAYSKYRTYSR
jgi:hypothetical protein